MHRGADPDRRVAGPAVLGGLRAEEVRQGLTRERFGDRLSEAVAAASSPRSSWGWIRIPGRADGPGSRVTTPPARSGRTVLALIAAAGPACVAVKPQMACFERLGARGWAALEDAGEARAARAARPRGRQARGHRRLRGRVRRGVLRGADPRGPGLGADALTVSPLLGRDPRADPRRRRPRGGGLFVLVRTSNPGAADVQELALAGGGTVSERLAELVAAAGEPGAESGLADVGAVVGATAPERLERLRELMPAAPFLLPGVGRSGRPVEDLCTRLRARRAGGLVTASRSIARAHEAGRGRARRRGAAEAERLRGLAWALWSWERPIV